MNKKLESTFLTEEQIASWKDEFKHVYQTGNGDTVIIYRPIRRSEYSKIMLDTEIPREDEQDDTKRAKRLMDRQTEICRTAVLYPENIDEELEAAAGLADNLSEEIMSHSGFGALKRTKEL